MILVTGATGFIGRAMVQQLTSTGYDTRILIRPSRETPNIPKGMKLDIVLASLTDLPGLRAAMQDVHTVIHLVTGEFEGSSTDLLKVDIEGTRTVCQAAFETGVQRIIYLSHLGADRASAFPVMKTKGVAENHIRNSGVEYTIIRSGLVYGPRDHFTTGLVYMLQKTPYIFLIPGDGSSLLQPIWLDDLIGCISATIENRESANRIYEVGGTDIVSILEVSKILMEKIGKKRRIVFVHPAFLRILNVTFENFNRRFPVTTYWLDYLSADRTCSIDTLPLDFGILPSRFTQKLDYLYPTKPLRLLDLLRRKS